MNLIARTQRIPSSRPKGPASGFTLIELMVTVSVGAILTAIAIPAFNSFVLNDRDSAQINSLAYSFNYARSEAVKRDAAVTVCPADTGSTVCNNSAAWANGWIVSYLDPANAAKVLQTVPALAGSNTVTPAGSATTGIKFLSSGMASTLTVPMAQSLTIKVCDSRGATFARDVEVTVAGRVAASQKPGFKVDGATALACP